MLPFVGMSATARKRKEEVAQALKKLIQSKGKTPALKYQQLFDDLRAQSEAVSVSQGFVSFHEQKKRRVASIRRVVNTHVNSHVLFSSFNLLFVCSRPSPRTCLMRRSEL